MHRIAAAGFCIKSWGLLWISGISGATLKIVAGAILCAILIDFLFFGVILPKNQVASSTFGLLHWVRLRITPPRALPCWTVAGNRRERLVFPCFPPQSPSSLWYVHSFWPLELMLQTTPFTQWFHGTFQVSGQKLIFAESRFQRTSMGIPWEFLGLPSPSNLFHCTLVEPCGTWTLLDTGAMNSAPPIRPQTSPAAGHNLLVRTTRTLKGFTRFTISESCNESGAFD